ncbi:F4 family fimbrial subunit [Escherichia coli]|uniref:F4 family fimbrial subunit n=1 Tax=Escherichia coli TaxID=562 RepID=UPI00140695EB|nr:hypothetical protein [Escherichia coli]ECR4856853.1 hypothetical protein [Salmonella enterica]EFH1501368.1 hypothetical protein [Escherichia coli]EGK7640586.1 hypothetical protein [Salmonella enterica]EGN6472423.1 hypothetical protein [Salmonella enterica]EIY6269335.1 hypothetical protein [Salmonella enterica]
MKVKKTLIALAVVTSSAVSGNAMAWVDAGTGGKVDFSGTLTSAVTIKQPWEVRTGSAVTGLDAEMNEDKSKAVIMLEKPAPVLSIRSVKLGFIGRKGISPQIDYHGVIDIDKFNDSSAPLTLEVTNTKGDKIGKMEVDMFAYAKAAFRPSAEKFDSPGWDGRVLQASSKAAAFFGGLPNTIQHIDKVNGDVRAQRVDADALETSPSYIPDGHGKYENDFSDNKLQYAGYYVSGIEAQKSITITLDSPVKDGERIEWKASLPVTVSYA